MPISCGEVPCVAFSFFFFFRHFLFPKLFPCSSLCDYFCFCSPLSVFRFGSNPRSRAISCVGVCIAWIRRENLSQWYSRRRKSPRSAFSRRAAHAFFTSANSRLSASPPSSTSAANRRRPAKRNGTAPESLGCALCTFPSAASPILLPHSSRNSSRSSAKPLRKKFFVHCEYGEDRTGVFIASYSHRLSAVDRRASPRGDVRLWLPWLLASRHDHFRPRFPGSLASDPTLKAALSAP